MLKGIGASQGFGIGKAVVIKDTELDYSSVKYSDAGSEKARLHKAADDFVEETKLQIEQVKQSAGEKEAEILEGHLMMLQDPFMLSQMEDNIDQGAVAESAVDTVCTMFIDMFSGVDDELTRQRASDVKDIKDNLLSLLLGIKPVDISAVEHGSVLVAKDFTPSMTSQINKENVCAIITEVGGVTSHSAILARAMGIPAVLSVLDATEKITDGEAVIADGFKGKVLLNPTPTQLDEYTKKQTAYLKEKESLNEYFGKQTVTKSGAVKKVYGNIGKAEDAQNVIQNGGEGIGLFRTEFLFMDRAHEPTEQEQFEAYSTVAKAMDGKEVIIRTLDIGGDKAIDYLSIEKEDNPFLGHRAIRYCLDNPQLFKTQLRALFRASAYGNLAIMYPMITSLWEVRRIKEIVEEVKAELTAEQLEFGNPQQGIMIETPAAVMMSGELAKEVDFFSIGTNDLTQYTLAIDRQNPKLDKFYDAHHPAVLSMIRMTVENAHKTGIWAGICGELGADTSLTKEFLAMGVDELSVSPGSILPIRKIILETDTENR